MSQPRYEQFRLNSGQAQKLTDWKNEPTILTLKKDLEACKPAQMLQVGRIERWNDLMAVRGRSKPPQVKGRSSVQPKLIRRQAEWRYSALTEPFLSSTKLFKVSPVTFEDDASAKQNELVLNYQFRTKINRVKFIDDYVRATVDEGTSILRVGWKRVTVPIKEMAPTFDHYPIESEEQAQALQQAIAAKQENLRTFDKSADPAMKEAIKLYEETGEATYAVQTGEQEITVDKVLENHPTVEVLNPKNFYIDPSCGADVQNAMFAVVSFETNKAELLKAGKRYKNLDLVNWQGNAPITEPDHETRTPQTFQFDDPLRKKVVAYEYWGWFDINEDGVLVPFVATWIGDVMIRMELNPYPDEKLPFVMVPYLPVKRDVYGEPDAELLEDNQRILGAVTRSMIDLLGRSANAQQGMAKGMLDPMNRRRFDRGEDYEFNPVAHPSQGMIEHKFPELPTSALTMLTLQNQEAEALTGVKSFSGGMSGEAYGEVAAGIRGVMDAASKREMAILRRLAKGMTEVGQKIIAMNGEFMSEEEVIRVTNNEFVTVTREELKGNFDLETDISTAEVDNAKAQDLGFMLQTIGPNTDPSIVMMILAEIAELKRMPVLADKLKKFKPQPSPEQQKLAELEIALKEAEVTEVQARIGLIQAQTQKAISDAEAIDVDTVETATGTKHGRDMEKQRAQAQGNQDLQVTKALTTPSKEGEKKPDIEGAIGWGALSDNMREVDKGPGFIPTTPGQLAGGMVPSGNPV